MTSQNDTDNEWTATLKRGNSYTLGTNPETLRRFVKGTEYHITDDFKQTLEERAVDELDNGDVDDEGFMVTTPKCKFDFRRIGEPAKAEAVAPRRRVRAG